MKLPKKLPYINDSQQEMIIEAFIKFYNEGYEIIITLNKLVSDDGVELQKDQGVSMAGVIMAIQIDSQIRRDLVYVYNTAICRIINYLQKPK